MSTIDRKGEDQPDPAQYLATRTNWKTGDPNWVQIIVDKSFPNYLDREQSVAAMMGVTEAFNRLLAMKPNQLTYVPGFTCVFAIWRHADKRDRQRVVYIYGVTSSEFYQLVERHLRGQMAYMPASSTTHVTYKLPCPHPHPSF